MGGLCGAAVKNHKVAVRHREHSGETTEAGPNSASET